MRAKDKMKRVDIYTVDAQPNMTFQEKPERHKVHKETTEYDPYEHRDVQHPTTDAETLIHLLKGSLGTGVLAMPMAFKNAGLWAGLAGSLVVSCVCTYCISMFIKCSYILCQRNKIPSLGFEQIAVLAFLEGPKCLHKFSKLAGYIIKAGLLTEMLGCCCAYNLFVAKSMKQIIEYYYKVDLELNIYFLLILFPLIAMNCLRNLKHLTPLSMISNAFFLFGVIFIFYYIFDDLPSITERPIFSSWDHIPIFLGTVIFALEGIGVVMPLENNMKNPRHFIYRPGILFIGMGILTSVYVLTGFFGYLKYGDKTEPSITLNIPVDTALGQLLKITVTIAVFFTYSLLFYIAMDLLGVVNGRIFNSKPLLYEYICRITIILATVLVAALFPNLGPFLSLVGSLSLCTVGLIYPPIVDTLVFWKTESCTRWKILKNFIIFIFGVIGLVTGTATSLKEFVTEGGKES